jgi:transcriptional regulator with PAS, ATPase and Fis domain
MQALQRYDWPGNVRELENVIERAIIRSQGDSLVLDQSLVEGTLPVRESTSLPARRRSKMSNGSTSRTYFVCADGGSTVPATRRSGSGCTRTRYGSV